VLYIVDNYAVYVCVLSYTLYHCHYLDTFYISVLTSGEKGDNFDHVKHQLQKRKQKY